MTCGRPSLWQVSRAAITAPGEQHARSVSGPAGSIQSLSVTPIARGPARSKRDRAIDTAAHRDGDALGIRLRAEDLRERVGQRVDGERLAADRRSLEQRQTFERALETRCVRGDDVLAFDGEPDERELGAAR